jgi:hypothetical protein
MSTYDIANVNEIRDGLAPRLQPYATRGRREGFICTMPVWFPTLLAGGEVVACEQDHSARAPFGAVGPDRGFRQIWFSKEAAEVRRAIRDRREHMRFCDTCPYADRPTADVSMEARQLIPDAEYPGLAAG